MLSFSLSILSRTPSHCYSFLSSPLPSPYQVQLLTRMAVSPERLVTAASPLTVPMIFPACQPQGFSGARHRESAWKQARKPRQHPLVDIDHTLWVIFLRDGRPISSGGAGARPHPPTWLGRPPDSAFVGVDPLTDQSQARKTSTSS
jgi:hypothetical protein